MKVETICNRTDVNSFNNLSNIWLQWRNTDVFSFPVILIEVTMAGYKSHDIAYTSGKFFLLK